MAQIEYACPKGAHGGQVRCRHLVPCPVHGADDAPAPRPDAILVKINLNPKWDEIIAKTGVREQWRDNARREELGRQHEERAKMLGRDAFIVRRKTNSIDGVPEDADSGTPVFGANGLQLVDVRSLPRQLMSVGYRLVDAHCLKRPEKRPTRLVLVFAREGTPTDVSWLEVTQLLYTCFGQVHVWANDRDKRGRVVHTVNCGQRQDRLHSTYHLLFKNGDWGVEILNQ